MESGVKSFNAIVNTFPYPRLVLRGFGLKGAGVWEIFTSESGKNGCGGSRKNVTAVFGKEGKIEMV